MKRAHLKLSGISVCLLLFVTACNDSATGYRSDTDSMTDESRMAAGVNDVKQSLAEYRQKDFVTDVLESNAEEMAWLRAGMDMGTDAELKSHAEMMMKDHEQMDMDMRDYAGRKNISLEDVDVNAVVRNNYRQGNDWDEEWADEMGDMHRKVIKRFERAQKRIEEPELNGMITKTIPTLQSHLEMAEKLEERLEGRMKGAYARR